MKKFLRIILSIAIIAGGLYGAWTAIELFDEMQTNYRDELLRSQLLNLGSQQRITELLNENERLQAELETLRALPAFAEMELEIEEEIIEEEDINVG